MNYKPAYNVYWPAERGHDLYTQFQKYSPRACQITQILKNFGLRKNLTHQDFFFQNSKFHVRKKICWWCRVTSYYYITTRSTLYLPYSAELCHWANSHKESSSLYKALILSNKSLIYALMLDSYEASLLSTRT